MPKPARIDVLWLSKGSKTTPRRGSKFFSEAFFAKTVPTGVNAGDSGGSTSVMPGVTVAFVVGAYRRPRFNVILCDAFQSSCTYAVTSFSRNSRYALSWPGSAPTIDAG